MYINDKEFLTLLGPSGCGKTTTLRIIGGFTTPTSGDVLFDGVRINDVPPNRRQINTVFQKYALFPHLNVFENVAFGLRLKRIPDPRDPSGKRTIRLSVSDLRAYRRDHAARRRHPSWFLVTTTVLLGLIALALLVIAVRLLFFP